MGGAPGIRSLAAHALWLLALAFGAAVARGEPATTGAAPETSAAVAGRVRVLARGLLGGLREQEDHAGVLLYLTGFRSAPPDQPALLRQRDERFEPRLLPIVAGQTVLFPNDDPIYHNVFSVAPLQPFDLGQYKSSEPPRSQVFAHPGLVSVYCNIHPKMIAYVAVLENAAFAETDPSGDFEIRGVPEGRVTLHAWTPGATRVSRDLELRAGERAQVELELQRVDREPPHSRKDGSPYPERGYRRWQ